MDSIIDWQISRNEIKARGQYLLETGKWSDCNFLIPGAEPAQQISLAGHKLILAMASPVFEAMFYGGLADPQNDPIQILDVQTDAFKALLEYIYTDKININSVDKAFDLCYAAKKYMLPHVVEQCTKFLWADLCFKNACRAFEFSKLFEEPRLTEKCLQIICTKTMDVISDSSFEDVELSTILTILDQDALNVDSELNLFFAINRYAEKHGLNNQNQNAIDEQQPNTSSSPAPPQISVEPGTSSRVEPSQQIPQVPAQQPRRILELPTIRDAVKKIRFLTLTPQQFAEGPARTNLLTQSEAFSILMNISTPSSVYPMPENFTINKNHRNNISVDSRSPSPALQLISQSVHSQMNVPIAQIIPLEPDNQDNKLYCIRSVRNQTECLNTSVLDCSLTFSVDRSGICILGLQVPTQIYHAGNGSGSVVDRYHEIVYSHLLDYNGSRLTYTHSNQKVFYDNTIDVIFNRPVYIQRHKIYKVGVVFNQVGWYQMSNCAPMVNCENGVTFTFGSPGQNECVRDGLIRGIIYTNSRD